MVTGICTIISIVESILSLAKGHSLVLANLYSAFIEAKNVGDASLNSRVGKSISAQAAPRTVRESLPSYGSYYPIMLLFQSSNDKTTMDFRLVSVDTSCITYPCRVSYMCSSSIYGLVHSNNKILHMLHLC